VPPDDQYGQRLKESIERDVHDRIQRKMARFEDKMRRRQYRHSGSSGIMIGAIIVLVGLGLLLDNMGIVHLDEIWQYWPVLLIVYGVSRVLTCQAVSSLIWGGTIALIGAFVLLRNLHIVPIDLNLIWPLLIIAFGLVMLARALDRSRYLEGTAPVYDESVLNIVAVFAGSKRVIETKDFRGGDIVAVFGGVRLDLRRAAIAADKAVLDISAVFGGVEILVPETWTITTKGVGIFGGFDDKTIHPKPDPNVKTPELIITGAAVFGGMSVSN